jgi:hypothetical protein
VKQYTAHSIMRGKTLEPDAVSRALSVQAERRKELLSRNRISLTAKERGEARRITGRWDFWEAA